MIGERTGEGGSERVNADADSEGDSYVSGLEQASEDKRGKRGDWC